MQITDINSIGWLHNENKTICLSIAVRYAMQPVFVTIPNEEFNAAGGIVGIKENKQLAIDFFNKYGTGRPQQ